MRHKHMHSPNVPTYPQSTLEAVDPVFPAQTGSFCKGLSKTISLVAGIEYH